MMHNNIRSLVYLSITASGMFSLTRLCPANHNYLVFQIARLTAFITVTAVAVEKVVTIINEDPVELRYACHQTRPKSRYEHGILRQGQSYDHRLLMDYSAIPRCWSDRDPCDVECDLTTPTTSDRYKVHACLKDQPNHTRWVFKGGRLVQVNAHSVAGMNVAGAEEYKGVPPANDGPGQKHLTSSFVNFCLVVWFALWLARC